MKNSDEFHFNEDDESYFEKDREVSEDKQVNFYNQQLENIIYFLASKLGKEELDMVYNALDSLCYLIHDASAIKSYDKGFQNGYCEGVIEQLTEFRMN